MLAFLLFNKQAFTSYYMLAVALVWLAVAMHGDEGAAGRGRDAYWGWNELLNCSKRPAASSQPSSGTTWLSA